MHIYTYTHMITYYGNASSDNDEHYDMSNLMI